MPTKRSRSWFLLPLATVVALGSVRVEAASSTATYRDLVATIAAPDEIEAETDFELSVAGTIVGGSAFGVFAYAVYEDASWTYDANHKVSVTAGTQIEARGFNWGSELSRAYALDRPAGTYTYTFVFGQRSSGHGWYDVAVDLEVAVSPAGPKLCGAAWRPPLTDTATAGRTIPLKFVAYDCDSGDLYEDTSVTVTVLDGEGVTVSRFSWTGNPHTGVAIGGGQYHVNWDTAVQAGGTCTIQVAFGGFTIDAFTRQIQLQTGGGRGARRSVLVGPSWGKVKSSAR